MESTGGNIVAIGMANGLAIAAVVTATGHISGGHINPAVTLALFASRVKGWVDTGAYISVQLAAGLLGAAAASAIWPGDTPVPLPVNEMTNVQAIAGEAMVTFILLLMVFGTVVDRHGTWFRVAGIPVGFTVAALVMAVGSYGIATMNPALLLGLHIVAGEVSGMTFALVAAQLVGAVAAALLYMLVFMPRLHGAPEPRT